jgi:Tfp pilus assembly protein FimT
MIQKIKTRRAFTMIELLIVVAIAMLLIAIAIPFIRPGIETSRLREAARQINTFIVGAKARAAESGRPFGVRLVRSSVDGTGDPNDCYRMQYVEVPPSYCGDLDNSKIKVGQWGGGLSPVSGVNPYLDPSNSFLRFSAWLDAAQSANSQQLVVSSQQFVVNGGETANEAWDRANRDALISPGDSIRFGFQGITYLILDMYYDTAASTPRLTLAPIYGKTSVNFLSASEHWPRNPAGEINQPFFDPDDPTYGVEKQYQIFRKPRVAGTSTLELPRNVSIDLALSGSSVDGNEFFADYDPLDIINNSYNNSTYADTKPIDIVFDPSGQVTNIVIGGVVNNTNSSVYLHVGRTENVVSGVGGRGSTIFPNYVTGPELSASQNLNNNDTYWVAVQYPSGAVLTAENLGGSAPNLAATRDLVRSGVAKGSR